MTPGFAMKARGFFGALNNREVNSGAEWRGVTTIHGQVTGLTAAITGPLVTHIPITFPNQPWEVVGRRL